ncbi:flagellar export chaperone FlgN [Clostridiaceae bacterium M8S5]|nr:flagellar export chaperone FlgN [Clostridiaceae bacterium M8S5]
MSEKLINDMNLLLEEKIDFLNQIYDYTKKQSTAVQSDDNIKDIETFVELKEIVIKKVDNIDLEFFNLINEFKNKEGIQSMEDLDTEKYPQAKKLQSSTADILSLLKKIKDIEQKNCITLNQAIKNVKGKLKNINTGKKMVSGYNTYKNVSNSVMIDQKR